MLLNRFNAERTFTTKLVVLYLINDILASGKSVYPGYATCLEPYIEVMLSDIRNCPDCSAHRITKLIQLWSQHALWMRRVIVISRFASSVIRRFENAFNGVKITQRFVKKVKETKPAPPPVAPPPPPLPQLKVASVRSGGASAAVSVNAMTPMNTMSPVMPVNTTSPVMPMNTMSPVMPTVAVNPTMPSSVNPTIPVNTMAPTMPSVPLNPITHSTLAIPMIPMQVKPSNPYETTITAANAPGGVFSDCYRMQREQKVPRYTPVPESALRRDTRPLSAEMEQEFEKTIDLLLKRVKTDTLVDGMEEQIQKVEEINEFIPRGELVFPKS